MEQDWQTGLDAVEVDPNDVIVLLLLPISTLLCALRLSGVAVAHGSSFGLGVYVWCPSGGLLLETWFGSCHEHRACSCTPDVMVCSGMSRLVME